MTAMLGVVPAWDQVPVPSVREFPLSVVEVAELHNIWSAPALAVVGFVWVVRVTSEKQEAQTPLVTVHLNLDAVSRVRLVICVVGRFGETIVATGPLTWVQRPIPKAGEVAAMIAVVPHTL